MGIPNRMFRRNTFSPFRHRKHPGSTMEFELSLSSGKLASVQRMLRDGQIRTLLTASSDSRVLVYVSSENTATLTEACPPPASVCIQWFTVQEHTRTETKGSRRRRIRLALFLMKQNHVPFFLSSFPPASSIIRHRQWLRGSEGHLDLFFIQLDHRSLLLSKRLEEMLSDLWGSRN